MADTKSGWSIPLTDPNYLARKRVDLSCFKYGIHIPLDLVERFLAGAGIRELGRGERLDINLQIDGKLYAAYITNVNRTGVQSDTIQIRYDSNRELLSYLKEKYKDTYDYLERAKSEGEGTVPESHAGYIDIYMSNDPMQYLFVLWTSPETNPFRTLLEKVLREYGSAQAQRFSGQQSIVAVVQREIPGLLQRLLEIDESQYKLQGSAGQGNWASVPWVAIMDRDVTESTRSGYYVVYAFSSDMQRVYLSLMLGVTERTEQRSVHEGFTLLQEETASFREKIGVVEEGWIAPDLGTANLARKYAAGTVTYVQYDKGLVPNDSVLLADLREMIGACDRIKQEVPARVELPPIEPREVVGLVHSYINAEGFQFSYEDVANFYLSLRTKPFVILAGLSGTGKSKLPGLFARAISASDALIPVRPDWNDGSDLLGYCDLEGRFKAGSLTMWVEEAMQHPETPLLVVLDEMNLARVEHYMSDLLSVMETSKIDKEDGSYQTKPLFGNVEFKFKEDVARFKSLMLPDNLYIIGTVNMDETTHPFSKKVLDRANTIEFSDVDLTGYRNQIVNKVEPIVQTNDQLRGKYLHLLHAVDIDKPYIDAVVDKLAEINRVLIPAGLHVGYRVRDEVSIYMLHNRLLKLLDESTAFDFQLMQKILPKLQGSSQSIRSVLVQMLKICGSVDLSNANDDLLTKLQEFGAGGTSRPYPRSATKLVSMLRRFEEDGFTSYWI